MQIPKIEKRFEVLNEAKNETATLYMYGSIGDGWFSDISSNDVRYQLKSIKAKTIHVHINSGGGDVFESIAIHNLLKNHDATIIAHIDGLAASGASVIAMAADKIIMPKNAMFMIHNAWTFASGNAKELRKVADDLDKISTSVAESYTNRFVGERAELDNLLDEETWLTAEEAKNLGFCDEIIEEIEEQGKDNEPKPNISAKEQVLNKYQNKVVKNQINEEEDEGTNLVGAFFNVFK